MNQPTGADDSSFSRLNPRSQCGRKGLKFRFGRIIADDHHIIGVQFFDRINVDACDQNRVETDIGVLIELVDHRLSIGACMDSDVNWKWT